MILAHCLFPGFQFFFLLCYIFSLYLLLLLLDFPLQGDLSTAAALFLLCLTSHHLHKFISIPSIQGLVCACFVWLLFSLPPFRLGKSLCSLRVPPSFPSINSFPFLLFRRASHANAAAAIRRRQLIAYSLLTSRVTLRRRPWSPTPHTELRREGVGGGWETVGCSGVIGWGWGCEWDGVEGGVCGSVCM